MEEVLKKKKKNIPRYSFNQHGLLVIEGRALSIKCIEAFHPIINWCKAQSRTDVYVLVVLEFLSMASLRQMMAIFNALDDNTNVQKVQVNWYYREDDSDIKEKGQLLSEFYPSIKFFFNRIYDNSSEITINRTETI